MQPGDVREPFEPSAPCDKPQPSDTDAMNRDSDTDRGTDIVTGATTILVNFTEKFSRANPVCPTLKNSPQTLAPTQGFTPATKSEKN